MKSVFTVIGSIIAIGAAIFYFADGKNRLTSPLTRQNLAIPTAEGGRDISRAMVITGELDTPWGIAFLPNQSMLVTERPGRVRLVDKDGKLNPLPVLTIASAKEIGEGGLLGIALHPDFVTNNYVYLYYTYSGIDNDTLNRVVRMNYQNQKLIDEQIIVDRIPGASNHNGGRIKFGPDHYLYISTGDAENPSQAQDTSTLRGKILRVTDEGKSPPDNPFNNFVYSYGHRNVQGLAWDTLGNLWATEHGRSGALSGFDELNLIEAGKNYGWPEIQGSETRLGLVTPRKNSGATTTWAPAGAAVIGKSFFFAGLRGQTLYEAVIEQNQVTLLREHLKGEYGRLRDVVLGPDGMLYVTTSNRDGRGTPTSSDDQIIRVNPQRL